MEKGQKNDQEFVRQLDQIVIDLDANQDMIDPDTYHGLKDKIRRVLDGMEEIKKEGRLLKVGVVGTVKAGKSTFLNALLFDGENFLPKAVTPMTAALTRLTYSETPKAKVTYYTTYDWENIRKQDSQYNDRIEQELKRRKESNDKAKNKAQDARHLPLPASGRDKVEMEALSQNRVSNYATTYATTRSVMLSLDRNDVEKDVKRLMPENLASSHQLVQMVEKSGLGSAVGGYLGKTEEIELDLSRPLNETLQPYVGSDGYYTPLVNYIELEVSSPLLKGLEIIDTPGLNDPIISRSNKTRDFLMNCDVVLVVSNMGQFLTAEDMDLLSTKLDEEAVNSAYIIGSQLDSALRQLPKHIKSLQEAYNTCTSNMERRAHDEIEKALRTHPESALLQALEKTRPEFISSMAFQITKKWEKGKKLTPEEDKVIQGLSIFTDFEPQDMQVIANMDGVRNGILGEVREKKESIIAKRIQNFNATHASELAKQLGQAEEEGQIALKALRTGDIETLNQKLETLTDKMNSIRGDVRRIFQSQNNNCRRRIQGLKIQLSDEISAHRELDITTNSREEERVKWSVFWGLIEKKDPVNITDHVADVSQAVRNLTAYCTRAQKMINEELEKIFDMDALATQIKTCVLDAFELGDDKFDKNEILLPLETALSALTIYEVHFDFMDDIGNAFYTAYPDGTATNEKIHALYALMERQQRSLLKHFAAEVDHVGEQIAQNMDLQSAQFVDTIQEKIAANIERTRRQLADRETNIARYEDVIRKLQQNRKGLQQLALSKKA